MTFDRESGLEELLRKEFRQFDPLSVPVQPRSASLPTDVVPTSGAGTPTIFVAAFDATQLSKDKADLVCTGIDDDLTIMTGINQITTVSPFAEGRCLLSEGTFNTTGQISVDGGTLQGLGVYGTHIIYTGSGVGIRVYQNEGTLRDFWITAPNGNGVLWEQTGS